MSSHTSHALTAAVLLGLTSVGVRGEPAGGAPIGYWPFEEGKGLVVRDVSGHERHGTVLNDARGAKWVTGRSGSALEFAGGDPQARNVAGCLAIAGLEDVDWAKGLTIELWIRFTRIERPNTYEIVSNTLNDRGPGFRFFLTWSMLSLRSGEGGAGKTWGAASEPSEVLLGAEAWYHLAATYDGSRFRTYIDGLPAGESDADLVLTPGDGTVYVGAYRGGYAYGLNAVVDDLRLYDYARTSAEIVMDAKLGG